MSPAKILVAQWLKDCRPMVDSVDVEELERRIGELLLRPMTSEQAEEQRRSFAYGNCKIENDLVTRDMVDKAAETA